MTKPRYGAWSMLPSTDVVEALARSGVDFVGIDAQHGALGFRDIVEAIRVCELLGVERIVRVLDVELELIPRVLDHGASGVMVAMVGDADTARRAVELARYQPDGLRSFGGRRFGLSGEAADFDSPDPTVWAMVETAAGLEAVEEIAAVPGLAGIFVGPVDLALALGGQGPEVRRLAEAMTGRAGGAAPDDDPLPERWRAAVLRVAEVSHAAGLEVGTFARSGPDVAFWREAGYDRIVIGSDIVLLRRALEAALRDARG